ncbi:hypothetical protein EU537_07480 [Candidatus Thorarchaeota archaeon]|nr:MAG: hypothetical protein EU537_07480 [Candidatus Thorarchaeota archaeon]
MEEDYNDPDICPNTGKTRWECSCFDCKPDIFRFKFLCIGCDDIDCVIGVLEGTLERFRSWKEQGYTIGGGIADDYMYILPPKREGFFAVSCSCGEVGYCEVRGSDCSCESCGRVWTLPS